MNFSLGFPSHTEHERSWSPTNIHNSLQRIQDDRRIRTIATNIGIVRKTTNVSAVIIIRIVWQQASASPPKTAAAVSQEYLSNRSVGEEWKGVSIQFRGILKQSLVCQQSARVLTEASFLKP